MNRFLIRGFVAALVVFVAAASAVAHDTLDRTAAFNRADRSATISSGGVASIERIAAREPGLRLMLDQTLGGNWSGTLEIVQKWTIQPGTRFTNSGLDRRGMPVQHSTTAKGSVAVYQIRSRVTARTVTVKDDCLNVVQARVPAVPMLKREAVTTWEIQEVTVDVNVVVNNNINTSATANATTAPITIVFNNVSQAAPLMAMGSQASPFVFVRDSRGLLSLGYTVGGGTRIYNSASATGGAGGNACVDVVNNNSNSNVNTNSNNTVVNTGSGTASGSSSAAGSGSSKAGGG